MEHTKNFVVGGACGIVCGQAQYVCRIMSRLTGNRAGSRAPRVLGDLFGGRDKLAQNVIVTILSVDLTLPIKITIRTRSTANADKTAAAADSAAAATTSAGLDGLANAKGNIVAARTATIIGATVGDGINDLSTGNGCVRGSTSISFGLSALSTRMGAGTGTVDGRAASHRGTIASIAGDIDDLSSDTIGCSAGSGGAGIALRNGNNAAVAGIGSNTLARSSASIIANGRLCTRRATQMGTSTTLGGGVNALSTGNGCVRGSTSMSTGFSALSTRMGAGISTVDGRGASHTGTVGTLGARLASSDAGDDLTSGTGIGTSGVNGGVAANTASSRGGGGRGRGTAL